MKAKYYTLAGFAILFALSLLALQIIGGLEYATGASFHTQASVVVAMVTVALLPALVGAAWSMSRFLAICLLVGFVAFLAYSLPATIGRIGEVKEGKALAAGDAADISRRLEDVRRTLRYAEPDMRSECSGAPEPLPSGRWQECRRKRGSVDAFLVQEARLKAELTGMGAARLGDTSSQTLAWALSFVGVSEETIRKGSGMALAIGLEVVIASLLALAGVAIRLGSAIRLRPVVEVAEVKAEAAEAKSAPRQPRVEPKPQPPSGRRGRRSDPKVIDFVRQYRAKHGRAPSGGEVQANFPTMPTSTAYDYAKRA